jgi:hypothetical protein
MKKQHLVEQNKVANKNVKQAVELYNSSLKSTSFYEFKPEFKVIANGI